MERYQSSRSRRQGVIVENLQGWGRGEALEIVSDSSSCSSYSTEDDSFSYKLRPSSAVKQRSDAPIKKLLAEELSSKMEPARRTPSVIGKLMGLDPLPPQQPIKKQPKKFSENYLKKTASIGYLDKKSSSEGLSGRRRSKEHQEFKDVYEVRESSRPENHPNRLMRERVEKKLNETKMEFVRQNFMDVKRLSTDEKLQQSKEFHDALEILDSNKGLLLKFLQEPDSLFAKHLHDLHAVPSPPQSGHITVLRSANAPGNLRKKMERNTEQNDLTSSSRKQDQGGGGITNSRRKNVYIPSKNPKPQSHEKGVAGQHPSRIVVLKPNLTKFQDTFRLDSSPDSLETFRSGHRKNQEFDGSESFDLYEEIRHRRDSSFDPGLTNHAAQESRAIAKEVARKMMHNATSGSKMVPLVKVRAGNQSSYSLSGNDSVYEFEVKTPTSKHFNEWKRYNSYSNESSVSREAKKRLSERWKMTRKVQETGKVSRGSTLGEMLAKPEVETRVNPSVSPDRFGDRLSMHGDATGCGSPLGISSRDGWKDECLRSLPRSRSLPASSTCFSPKTSAGYGFMEKDRHPMPRGSVNWRLNNSKKVDSAQIDELFFRNDIKPSHKRSPYAFSVGEEKYNPLRDFNPKPDEQNRMDGEVTRPLKDSSLKPDEVSVSFEGSDFSEANPSTLDILVDDRMETTISVNDQALSADNSNPETPVRPSGGSSMFSHCTVESHASSKEAEAEQPSPDSVLEPPCVEEFSPSSDSFEKISADLHGLRMQLNLLKLDSSDGSSEGAEMIVSSDEDRGNKGLTASFEVNKGYSYLVDALVDSGFHDADLDTLLKTWYSLELPMAPSVFDRLEKKYGEQPPWLRSDRKLLFDRINLGLVELLRPHMDPHPWVQKTGAVRWNEDRLVQELWGLLAKQEREAAECSLETAMMKEMNWFDMAGDVNAVGSGIERFLFDDLVAETVGSLLVM